MNILFANYGDFATNSISHIAGFANALSDAGHACVVAVPWAADTIRAVPEVRFRPALFSTCLENESPFPNGKPADIVHAWTPREVVREFVLRYCAISHARLVVHLEDNEDYLFAAATGLPIDRLLQLDELTLRERLHSGLSHPRRARLLLQTADGVTTIVPTLRTFAPAGVPVLDLPPGVDFELFRPQAQMPHQRAALGFRNGEKCIVYTGSTSFANAAETHDLYAAVGLLNQRGVPTRLIRTGADDPAFAAAVPAEIRPFVHHLGFIPRTELPQLLAHADVLVQPGRPGPFNDFRLPSKVPEFLASGRPVILPASNIGLDLRPDEDAIVLAEGTPEHIADACERVFQDADFAARLGRNGAARARARFGVARQTAGLAKFYAGILAMPAASHAAASIRPGETEISLASLRVVSHMRTGPGLAAAQDLLDLLLPLIRNLDLPVAERADLARVEQERDLWRNHFEAAREHAANLATRRDELTRDLDALKLAHAIEVDQLRQAVAQREDRIERMRSTFSWQLTMPLRAMRRLLARASDRGIHATHSAHASLHDSKENPSAD